MTATEKLNSTTEVISKSFLEKLAAWAYSWRNRGQFAHDKFGEFSQLAASWKEEFGESLISTEPALQLCRELVARGKEAFTV